MPVSPTKPFLGMVSFKKTAGSGAVAVNTQINIPVAQAMPSNPTNTAYPVMVNKSGYGSIKVAGKKTPFISVSTVAKASWFTAAFLNSLIVTLDASNNTDEWAIQLWDADTYRIYDGAKCSRLSLYQTISGIAVDMDFVCQYGESEKPTPTTFAAVSASDAGAAYDPSSTVFSGTVDAVRSWRIDAVRGQGHVMYLDGSLYPSGVATGMFSGTFTVEQSPNATALPGSSLSVTIGPSTTGVKADMLLNYDTEKWDQTPALGTRIRSYTLIDTSTGGNPLIFSAAP